MNIELNIKDDDIYAIAQTAKVLRSMATHLEKNKNTRTYPVSPNLTGTCYMTLSALCFEDVFESALAHLKGDTRFSIDLEDDNNHFMYLYQRLEPFHYRGVSKDIVKQLDKQVATLLEPFSEVDKIKVACKQKRKNGKLCKNNYTLFDNVEQVQKAIVDAASILCPKCEREMFVIIANGKLVGVSSDKIPDSHPEEIEVAKELYVGVRESIKRKMTKEDRAISDNTIRLTTNVKTLTINMDSDDERIKTEYKAK